MATTCTCKNDVDVKMTTRPGLWHARRRAAARRGDDIDTCTCTVYVRVDVARLDVRDGICIGTDIDIDIRGGSARSKAGGPGDLDLDV